MLELDKKAGFGIPYENLPHVATLHALGLEIVNRKPRAVRLRKTDLRVQSVDSVKQLLFRDAAFILGHKKHDAEIAIQKQQNGTLSEDSNDISYSIFTKYWEIMSKCNSIDFDDQINFACKILENDQQIPSSADAGAPFFLPVIWLASSPTSARIARTLARSNSDA